MPVRFPKDGNVYWPLPPDYPELSADGQRLARVNAVTLRETPEDDVASWHFMRGYYLNWEGAHWYDDWTPPAPEHYEWAHQCATHDRVIVAATRGSAKSTIFAEFGLRDLISVPYSKTLLVMSGRERVIPAFNNIMQQIDGNDRIVKDFGKLRCDGHGGLWNHSILRLANGAWLRGSSVTSRTLRGDRPHRILLDDPEYDPRASTDTDKLVENMEILLFRVLLPMLRRGSILHWIGTPISKRLFLWRIVKGEMTDKRVASDRWFKAFYPIIGEGGKVFWASENTPEELARKRQEFGVNFNSECMLNPQGDAAQALKITGDTEYTLSGDLDPAKDDSPLHSPSIIQWVDCYRDNVGNPVRTERRQAAGDTFAQMTRFCTIDACRKPSETSDWSVIHVMGVDKLNQIWSLDLWDGKASYYDINKALWPIVMRWKLRLIGVESIAQEADLLAQVRDSAKVFSQRLGWVPSVKPIEYDYGVEKEDRINGLVWRFERGIIKLPTWRRFTHKAYTRLFDQIDAYQGDCEQLPHDDHLDTLAMCQEIVKSRQGLIVPDDKPKTVLDLLASGELYSQEGHPLVGSLNITDIPNWVINKARDAYYGDLQAPTDEPSRSIEDALAQFLQEDNV